MSFGDFAHLFQSAEQGYFATLRRNFDFWVLVYYAIECPTLDDFMTIIDDTLLYDIEFMSTDHRVLYLGLEYFYQMLFDRYMEPQFKYMCLEYNHCTQIKVLGKEGLVVWLNVD